MLRTLLDEIVGRLRQFGSHADSLEDENHRLQAELATLLAARRENDDTFTIRQWDGSGTTLVTRSPRPRIFTWLGPRSGSM